MAQLEVCGALGVYAYPGKAGLSSVTGDRLGAVSVRRTRDVGKHNLGCHDAKPGILSRFFLVGTRLAADADEAVRACINREQTSRTAALSRVCLWQREAGRLGGSSACTAPPRCAVVPEVRQASAAAPRLFPRSSWRRPTPEVWAAGPPITSTKTKIGRSARATRACRNAATQVVHGPRTASAGRVGLGAEQGLWDGWGQVWAAMLERQKQHSIFVSPARKPCHVLLPGAAAHRGHDARVTRSESGGTQSVSAARKELRSAVEPSEAARPSEWLPSPAPWHP